MLPQRRRGVVVRKRHDAGRFLVAVASGYKIANVGVVKMDSPGCTHEPIATIPLFSLDGCVYERARICKIYDGDSITLVLPLGAFGQSRRVKCRLYGVDACEITGDTREHGREARQILVDKLGIQRDPEDKYKSDFFDRVHAIIKVWCHGFDKYGRVLVELGRVGGRPINRELCDGDHYAEYWGDTKRPMNACRGEEDDEHMHAH